MGIRFKILRLMFVMQKVGVEGLAPDRWVTYGIDGWRQQCETLHCLDLADDGISSTSSREPHLVNLRPLTPANFHSEF